MRGKEDPFATVGVANDRSQKDGTNEYVKVLDNINFEVKKGEVLGIIGKNGAGKSTLLKVISQITSPTTGSVKAKGRIASLLEVGTGMHPEMTGRENVYLNGTILGMTRREIDAKFDEIMDFAGCAKYAETPVKRYSSGMKVRLGFAVAAFLEPEILIVDEVLAVGDAEFQKKAIGKMQDISQGDGRTVLFVSHNMHSVNRLCKKLLLLSEGRIDFHGDVQVGIEKYMSNSLALRKNKIGGEFYANKINSSRSYIRKIEIIHSRSLMIGEDLHLKLEIENPTLLKNIKAAIQIKDEFGMYLINSNNEDVDCEFYPQNNFSVFEIKIPDIRFYPGKYLVDVWLGSKRSDQTYDYCENAVNFEVVNVGKNVKRPLTRSIGLVYMDVNWVRSNN